MIASGVLYTSFQNLAISIPLERDDGTLKRLRGTPMPQAAYFVGKIGMVFVVVRRAGHDPDHRSASLFYDLELPEHRTQWFTFVWASVLGLVACTLLGLAFSLGPEERPRARPRSCQPIVLVLQFTSGVFFVYSELPDVDAAVRRAVPAEVADAGDARVFLPPEAAPLEVGGSWAAGRCAAVLASWCVAGLVLSLLFFRWAKRGQD